MSKKKDKIAVEINDYSLKNDLGEWLDASCHFEGGGYVVLTLDTQPQYTINSLEDLDEIYNKIKEMWPKEEIKKTQE